MGSEKQQSSGTTITNQTTTPTPTAAEQEMEKLQLEQYKQYQPSQTQMFNNAYGLGNQLLTSFGDKSGSMWQSLIGGITPAAMNYGANQAVNTANASLNQAGIVDSGAAAVSRARAAADSYNTNQTFNVGALQNALSLALSGSAQVQGSGQANSSQLAGQLAGLRSINTSGTSSSNQTSVYTPSFGQQLGQGMSAVGGLMGGFGGMMYGMRAK